MKGYEKTARLIFRYIRQELNFLEEKKLRHWRSLSEANESFFQQETSQDHIRERLAAHEESKKRIFEKLHASFPANWVEGAPRKPALVIRMLKYAAIFIGSLIVILGGLLAYEIFFHTASPKDFAMMVTVNGQRVILTDFQLGMDAGHKHIEVHKKQGGDLLYIVPNNSKAQKGESDSLWTPDKWRFELRLADGSDIWMNLSSSISYPRNFIGSDSVSYNIQGEAFFKIPENTNRHYEISTGALLIQATNAELDVRSNAGNGSPGALLVSGNASVRISNQTGDTTQAVHLNPGQQARLVDGKIIVDEHPDIKGITAWKK